MVRGVVTLFLAAVSIYLIMDFLPGDAATQSLGPANAEQLSVRRTELGLDRPVWERLAEWLVRIFRGDLGNVLVSGKPVVELALPAARNTAILAAVAVPLVLCIGVAGGVFAGVRNSRVAQGVAQTFIAIPDFAVATLLVILLAVQWQLVPQVSLVRPGSTPLETPIILVIPALALGIAAGSWLLRMVCSVIIDVANLPHVQAARLAGIHPWRVIWKHMLPVAAAPIAQLVAAVVPYLISGAVVIESVVGYPGIGGLLTGLVSQRETEAVASLTTVIAAITLVGFAIADQQKRRLVVAK
ncbi:ABC transporter permease [Corynebacterium freiburgense]|uniref:ABC transporter permease n=1 Tax=Corynebacterium freiburgense TaxID=556548 RepID=UPI00146FAEDA